jgi:hypothetical protein
MRCTRSGTRKMSSPTRPPSGTVSMAPSSSGRAYSTTDWGRGRCGEADTRGQGIRRVQCVWGGKEIQTGTGGTSTTTAWHLRGREVSRPSPWQRGSSAPVYALVPLRRTPQAASLAGGGCGGGNTGAPQSRPPPPHLQPCDAVARPRLHVLDQQRRGDDVRHVKGRQDGLGDLRLAAALHCACGAADQREAWRRGEGGRGKRGLSAGRCGRMEESAEGKWENKAQE